MSMDRPMVLSIYYNTNILLSYAICILQTHYKTHMRLQYSVCLFLILLLGLVRLSPMMPGLMLRSQMRRFTLNTVRMAANVSIKNNPSPISE